MKKESAILRCGILNLVVFLPIFLLMVIALNSCSASKNATSKKTETAPPPPPPPPALVADEPYVMVEEMPVFPGGDSALLSYIGKNTKYPGTAKENNIQGRVIVRFCVTKDGAVERISVIN
jgi:outer membrane biosynthesis protein TonB